MRLVLAFFHTLLLYRIDAQELRSSLWRNGFPKARRISLPKARESLLRSTAAASKYKINFFQMKQYAMHSEDEKSEILDNIKDMEHLNDGYGTFQGEFDKSYQRRIERAPMTESLVRAIQERVDLELKGLAPPPKKFKELRSSTVVRTGNEEGVCRISDEGMVCENPFRAEQHVADSLTRRRKRRKRRKNKKKPAAKPAAKPTARPNHPSGINAGGGIGVKDEENSKPTKGKCKKKKKGRCVGGFGTWKDNGMGMLCNGWKCKPKPTRFPQPTTTKAVHDGQLNDAYGRISFDHLYQTLIELDSVHPLKNFKYLNLNGNYLVGDVRKLKDILCLMPQITEFSAQACGMSGVFPADTFQCTPNLVNVDLAENGFFCAKGAFDTLLTHDGEDDDGKPYWPLKKLNFFMNPMTSRCYFVRTGDKPFTIAKYWDYEALRKGGRVTINEWAPNMKKCLNEEPNCITNAPSIDMMFFAKRKK